MVVIKIKDNNEVEYGVELYENNFDGEVEIHDTFHCAAEIDEDHPRDTIFGSNDAMVTVHVNPAKTLAEHVKEYIINEYAWCVYDDDLVRRCIEDTLSDLAGTIRTYLDAKMEKHIGDDNVTILGKEVKDCPHKCGDCVMDPGECIHGCDDCGHFDGGNCVHIGSSHCGCNGGLPAHDCGEWEGE